MMKSVAFLSYNLLLSFTAFSMIPASYAAITSMPTMEMQISFYYGDLLIHKNGGVGSPLFDKQTISLCFSEGTLVYTHDGYKHIKNVQIGDLVLTKDEESGKISYNRVENRIVTPKAKAYSLTLGNEHSVTENFIVTAQHPFYVKDEGFKPVKHYKLEIMTL